jgi:hypothetical protein
VSITLHFHPDWPHGDGLVIESMAADGTYRNQFVTGISNGLLAPAADSPRRRWEDRLFGDRYATAAAGDRPVYGSWSRRADPYGGSPRFGSAHFRLRRAVADRATYCFPDSTFEPDAFGGPDRLEDLCRRADAAGLDEPLDDYVEAQVHGGVLLGRDVEALVLDPCHATGPVRDAAERLGCPVEVHPGYRVSTASLPEGYRGPEPLALMRSLGEEVTPDRVALARRSGDHDPQVVKRAWHLLARFGRRA